MKTDDDARMIHAMGRPKRLPTIRPSVVLILWYCLAAASPVADDAARVVDGLHNALTKSAGQADSLSYELRFRQIEPIIAASHDFDTIARLVGGHFWRQLADDERLAFREAFCRASIATYTRRFTSSDGLRFGKATVLEKLDGRIRVLSALGRTDGDPIMFEYLLQETDGNWRILVILVDGVSELALRRAELTKIFDDAGFRGVIEHLDTQVPDPATSRSANTAEQKARPPKSSMACRINV